jgi:hypothetical protein
MNKKNIMRIMELESLLQKKEIEIAHLRSELSHIRKVEQQELLECLIDDGPDPEKDENACSYKVIQ